MPTLRRPLRLDELEPLETLTDAELEAKGLTLQLFWTALKLARVHSGRCDHDGMFYAFNEEEAVCEKCHARVKKIDVGLVPSVR